VLVGNKYTHIDWLAVTGFNVFFWCCVFMGSLGKTRQSTLAPLTVEGKLGPAQTDVIESLLASIGLGIVVTDCAGRLLLFNSAAGDILGAPVADMSPDQWPQKYGFFMQDGLTLCPSEDSPLLRAIKGECLDRLEFFLSRPGSTQPGRWCSINLRPLTTSPGQIDGGIILIQDITAYKNLANEAARSNDALRQFASVAAHDLQEPLRSVAGFQDMLVDHLGDSLDEKGLRYTRKVKDGVKRMQILINDLLSFSLIQTKPRVLEQVDTRAVVQNCLRNLEASIAAKGAVIETHNLPTVMADPSQLSQLFQNLLSNALKFVAPETTPAIKVSAVRSGPEWIFALQDNGIGLEMQFAQRIFLVFQRLHATTAYGGTGIGLAICKRIVDAHGGRIWVESEIEKGSTFYFTLRATNEECAL